MQSCTNDACGVSLKELMTVAWDPLLVVHCESRRIIDANPAASRLYGIEPEQLIGSDYGLRFSDRRLVAEIFERHRDYIPLRFQRGAANRRFPVEISLRYFMTEAGEHAAIAVRDISDRMERDRIDNESERKYQSLFEASPYPILILNPHGIIVDANRCAQIYYGYEQQELSGLPWQTIDQSSASGVQFSARPTMLGSRQHRRKDETTFMAEVMLSYFRLRGQTMILALIRDVTEHWRTFQQLQESEARWRFAIEGSGDAVIDWPVEDDGSHYFSPRLSAMLGYSPEEDGQLDIQDWRKRVHPDDLDGLHTMIRAHLAGLEPIIQSEHRLCDKDGNYRWVSLRAKMIRGGETVPRLIGAVRDIHASHLRKLQETTDRSKMFRLERLATAGEMLSALAHEVNQPLTAISNYGALAVRQLSQPANEKTVQRSLNVICEQSLRAGEIVRRIREFVRRDDPNYQSADLNLLITRVAGWCNNDASAAGIPIQLDLTPQLEAIELDILQIEQLLFNLVRNGIEAMVEEKGPPPHRLLIASRSDGHEVTVVVRDHGCGMKAEIIDDMFEPFVSSKPDGMGMGLAICRTIVENHGGRIWAEPLVGQRGTQFSFTLRLRRPERVHVVREAHAGH